MKQQIGRHIGRARLALGLSLELAAAKNAVSKGLLIRIENARVASPIATLSNIAIALGTSVERRIGATEGEHCVVVGRTERRWIACKGQSFGYTYEVFGHERRDKRMEQFTSQYPARRAAEPAFTHGGEGLLSSEDAWSSAMATGV